MYFRFENTFQNTARLYWYIFYITMFTKFIVFLSKKFLICHYCPFFGTYYIIQCSHKAREKQNFSQIYPASAKRRKTWKSSSQESIFQTAFKINKSAWRMANSSECAWALSENKTRLLLCFICHCLRLVSSRKTQEPPFKTKNHNKCKKTSQHRHTSLFLTQFLPKRKVASPSGAPLFICK